MDLLEKACLAWLHSVPGIGNRSLWWIKENFKSFAVFFKADNKSLQQTPFKAEVIDFVLKRRLKIDPVHELEKLLVQGFDLICYDETAYPGLLRTIPDAPILMYYRGDLAVAGNLCVAVVGSRAATNYGKTMARKIAGQLGEFKITVVSGMARGIDTQAHLGVLENTGKTIAVLGSGLDVVYPKENQALFEDIGCRGLVLSEFPLHMPPEPGNFPRRNRIISGLSQGVLVIEARKKSGALITANFALEQGRDVFALPGPVTSMTSQGTNELIKQGAIPVTEIEDIINEYLHILPGECLQLQQEVLPLLEDEEAKIVEQLEFDPCHFDLILRQSGMEIGQLSTILLKLELKGIVKSLPGNYYVKI